MNSWPRWPDWRACPRPLWPLGGPRPLYPVDRAHCWSSSCAQRARYRKTANWKYCCCPRSVTGSGGSQTKIKNCKVRTAFNNSTFIWNHDSYFKKNHLISELNLYKLSIQHIKCISYILTYIRWNFYGIIIVQFYLLHVYLIKSD